MKNAAQLIMNKEDVYTFVHDLKNPLSAISSVVSCLEGLDEVQQYILKQGIIKITQMADSLLEERKRVPVKACAEKRRNNLKSIIHQVRLEYLARGLLVKITPSDLLDKISIWVNEVSTYRALNNVLANAMDASPMNVDIDIFEDSEYVNISIKDYGTGFTKEMLEKLNHEVYVGMTNKPRGNGLGLVQVKNYSQDEQVEVIFKNHEFGGEVVFKFKV